MADEINVKELVTEVKTAISDLQAVNDERAEQLNKTGNDIAELQAKQKELAEDLDRKVGALEKVTATLSQVREVKAEDKEYIENFNKSLQAMKQGQGRQFNAMSAEDEPQHVRFLFLKVCAIVLFQS